MRRRRSPTRRIRQRRTQRARGGVRTCLASRVGTCFGPQPAAPLADLANFEGSAHCSSIGASASVLVGQMASSVAVVSVISAENSSMDWATRKAATRRLWCTIHGVPRAREPQRGVPASPSQLHAPRPRVILTVRTHPPERGFRKPFLLPFYRRASAPGALSQRCRHRADPLQVPGRRDSSLPILRATCSLHRV